MKRLRYVRHSYKDGANNTIGPKGLAYAAEKAPAGEYTDVFHGPLYRTAQTALAVVCALGTKAMVHPPVAKIGSEELFTAMVNDAFKAAVKAGKSNIDALYEAHIVEQIFKWAQDAADGVEKMLNMMQGNFGLALGHDPVIPLATRALAYGTPSSSLKEMEYIDFILHDDGKITVEDPRVIPAP